MFTLTQIYDAHAQVKTGGDFPTYVAALKELGVERYMTFVHDGHTEYYGVGGFSITSPALYPALAISVEVDTARLKECLMAHQAGQTDYATFCSDMAAAGVVCWEVRIEHMTCVYYSNTREVLLAETILFPA